MQRTEPYITAATQRCREQYRLDPGARPRAEHIGGAALRLRREELDLFQRIAGAEMRRLFRDLSRSGCVLLLTDETGVLLDICAATGDEAMLHGAGMQPGFIWDERHQGTNGPGTCLHDRRARVVHREEHFFHANRGMTCSAAPIWGPNRRLLGALDASRLASNDSRASQEPTLALIGLSARLIEQAYFTSIFADSLIVRLHDRPGPVFLPQDGLLAIDEDGCVRAVDSAALVRFGELEPHRLLGRSLADIVGVPLEHLRKNAARDPFGASRIGGDAVSDAYASLLPSAVREATRSYPAGESVRRDHPGRESGGRVRPSRPVSRPGRSPGIERRRVPLLAPEGCDPTVAESIWRAGRVLDRDIHVLLQGETGTGKDRFARTLHAASERFDKPFVAVNCAAIPDTLIESELFGYEPGAFTGARAGGAPGKVIAADHGTLFLDEIGDMPLGVQARLLRLLEEKEVVPLGGTTPIQVDLKVISATHRDLPAMVAAGDFRADLFFRLNGVTIALPPLRARADRAALIETICREERGAFDGSQPGITEAAKERLLAHDWPGNIRELRNVLRTAIAFADNQPIGPEHLPGLTAGPARTDPPAAPPQPTSEPAPPSAPQSTSARPSDPQEERLWLLAELERQRWRIGKTAAALGISRNTLYRKLHRHRLMPGDR